MCGIVGLWSKSSNTVELRISDALKCMRHRGPDDIGHELYQLKDSPIALGHARLSIIDLSNAGHQPMHSQDGRWAIVFNGEIYNFKELRSILSRAGFTFKSNSDTEVLLGCWIHWGSQCLNKLVGMFAFSVFDKQNNTITCVRDAFGIKPLYYKADPQEFAFASEINSLLRLTNTSPRINYQRAYDYLVHGDYDNTSETFFDSINQLPPGHCISLDLNNGLVSQPTKWWKPSVHEHRPLSFNDAAEQVRTKFLNNIALHLRSDVPLGAALSGGIDSSAVVCAMRHLEPDMPIHTFSYVAENSSVSEEHWIDLINNHVNAIPHKVAASPAALAIDLDEMIVSQGEPFGSTSIYAQYCVFRRAKEEGIKVTLDGQGADEMLAGYNGYPGQRLHSLLDSNSYANAWNFFTEWSKWPGRSKFDAAKSLTAQLLPREALQIIRTLKNKTSHPQWIRKDFIESSLIDLTNKAQDRMESTHSRRLVSQLIYALTQNNLPSLLRHADRNSMRFSIESRVPFLTTELAELLLSLPEDYLISQKGETKHIFRHAMRGIVPDAILDRKDKIGFETPEHAWMLTMSKTIRMWISNSPDIPILDTDAVIKEFDLIIAGKKNYSWQVWRWINFYRWHQLFFRN